jgi:thioredoxin reductase (NADPH)
MGSPMHDVCVIGGGPAGLTAALYLARFHLMVSLVDGGESRAALIPTTHNQPFWPEGIEGWKMLDLMRSHLARYPVQVEHGTVEEVQALATGFAILSRTSTVLARTVLVATGVQNHRPSMAAEDHARALRAGLLRYCPICDGYEVTDKGVAVVGTGDRLFGEAKFLRSYTSSVTVLSESSSAGLTVDQRETLTSMGVRIVGAPVSAYRFRENKMDVLLGSTWLVFDTMYAALGSTVRSGFLRPLGVEITDEGCLVVDAHQRTSLRGLYAAGDVVVGVDQISHAMGQATVAATAIRNDLNAARALVRKAPDAAGR